MFFAYNNGITATAERVTTRMSDAGLLVTELHNLQTSTEVKRPPRYVKRPLSDKRD